MGETDRYKVNILGVSEMRWTDSEILTLNSGETVCYSGRMDGLHQEGVGIVMDKAAKKSLLGWEAFNSRIIRARFFSKYVKTTIIKCYAPTDGSSYRRGERSFLQHSPGSDRQNTTTLCHYCDGRFEREGWLRQREI